MNIEDRTAVTRDNSQNVDSSLDMDMQKLFREKDPLSLPSTSEPTKDSRLMGQRYSEEDFRSHRRSSFPHIHQPLEIHVSKSSKSLRSGSLKHKATSSVAGSSHPQRSLSVTEPIQKLFTPSLGDVDECDNKIGKADDNQSLSQRSSEVRGQDVQVEIADVVLGPASLVGSPKHVGFILGGESESEDTESVTSHDDDEITAQTPLLQQEPNTNSRSVSDSSVALISRASCVAAQRFQSQTMDEPAVTQMFSPIDSDKAQTSQQAAKPMINVPSMEKAIAKAGPAKVKFIVGTDTVPSSPDIEQIASDKENHTDNNNQEEGEKEHYKKHKARDSTSRSSQHRRHHHHHHHYHHRNKDFDIQLRRTPGSEVQLENMAHVATAEEDLAEMGVADVDNITSHRFADPAGIRRHKIERHAAMVSTIEIGQKGVQHRKGLFKPKKKNVDHSPHEVFVELDELFMGDGKEWEWREKARWIKFEEDVEEGAKRWGKPHVASLSFHSLLELRKGLETGVVLLDLEATDFCTVVNSVVENMILQDLLQEENRGHVLHSLLLKHKHVSEKKAFIPRNFSYQNLKGLDSRKYSKGNLLKNMSAPNFVTSHNEPQAPPGGGLDKGDESKLRTISSMVSADTKVDIESNGKPAEDLHIHMKSKDYDKHDLNIMRKIPKGAEATTVLVGSVDYLDQPIMSFIRLSEGQLMHNVTEVPLPVRFLFILLGPQKTTIDYHEIGRSISTLMSNARFHDVAYEAEDRKVLLSAINEFLDESIVLPPGDWDQKTLLPIMDMARKKSRLRRGKAQQQRDKLALVSDEADKKKEDEDPLKRTGRCFGGVIRDVKRRYPYYASDFTDAFNAQCLAAFIFIYFAALSPAITFGGLLSEKTQQLIGVSEMLVATCFCGVIFGLLSAQPMIIIGATGPIIIFEESLFSFCESQGIEFLSFRVWIGIWVAIISVIVVAFDGSFLVRYFTRFTQEIFASLISLIFIYEVFKKLTFIFVQHPLKPYYPLPLPFTINTTTNTIAFTANLTLINYANNTGPGRNLTHLDIIAKEREDFLMKNQPNTALLSTIMMLGTFIIAFFLKQFRNSKFLGRNARRALGDFGIPIAIFLMVVIDVLIKDTYTQKLYIPEGISPTDPTKRGWLINPLGMVKPLPIFLIFAAALPGFLVFILVFMESQITGTIVNKKDRKLKKGSGYHLDMLLIGLLEGVMGLCGLPFMCAATVRSVSHVSALTVMSRTHAPGEKPKLIEVKEQRLTGILVNIMVGVSVAMGPVLKEIPIAVLFGVFLYMGIASMSGIQMFERIELMFMPVKHHPGVGYVRRVRTFKMHIFTVIQILCLGVLWAVKSTPAALAFPFVLILMVPIRLKVLKYLFTKEELHELDRDEEDTNEAERQEEEDEDEKDFYAQAVMPC